MCGWGGGWIAGRGVGGGVGGIEYYTVTTLVTLRTSLSGTFLQRKDVVNECLEFGPLYISSPSLVLTVRINGLH